MGAGTVLEGGENGDGKLAIIVRRKLLQPKAHPKVSWQLYPFNCCGIFVKTVAHKGIAVICDYLWEFLFQRPKPRERVMSIGSHQTSDTINKHRVYATWTLAHGRNS